MPFFVIFSYDIQYAWNTLDRVVKYTMGKRKMVTDKLVHTVKY